MRLDVSLAACLALAVLSAGCASPHAAPGPGGAGSDGAFRVRSDTRAPLNADQGWAAAQGQPARVFADRPFRIRFEARPGPADSLRLQVRRGGGPWGLVGAHDFPYPEAATPRVSVVSAEAYTDGTATTDLLSGSALPFSPGAGVSLNAASGTGASTGSHGEWEWPLVVRRYADGPVANEDGDAFAFRLVDGAGRPVSPEALVTLAVAPGHLGGTFVETPSRIGPFEASNGDLYVIMEPTETDNVMMAVKSSDGGRTWHEADGANRPSSDDLEGVGAALHDGTLHVLHQTSEHVWHHAFHTSDHPTAPDTWALTDELVAEPGEPPTQVASLAARPDGTLIAVYGGPQTLHLRARSARGAWSAEVDVAAGGPVESGPHLETGGGEAVHLAYTASDGTAWIRRVRPGPELSPALRVADGLGTTEFDVGAVAPLAFMGDAVVVVYRRPDGGLWSRWVGVDGAMTAPVRVTERAVAQNPVDSDQVAADVVAVGAEVHVLFAEDRTGHLYHARASGEGEWSPARLIASDLNAQWVRALPVGAEGVLGYVVDAGSDGGAGKNRYGEVRPEK